MLKKDYFSHVSPQNVHVYQFLAKLGCRSVKTVDTNIFTKFKSCVNLQQPIIILNEKDYFLHASPQNVHVYQYLANSS